MDNTAIYSGDARTDKAVILIVDDYFDSTEFAGLMGKAAAEAGNALVPMNRPVMSLITILSATETKN